ncbi:MAG: DUF2155 domain-containing protein [Alphaproteobacteria bacterium]
MGAHREFLRGTSRPALRAVALALSLFLAASPVAAQQATPLLVPPPPPAAAPPPARPAAEQPAQPPRAAPAPAPRQRQAPARSQEAPRTAPLPPGVAPPPPPPAPRVVAAPRPMPHATLQALEKVAGRVHRMEAEVGRQARWAGLDVTVRECMLRASEDVPDSVAFVEVSERRPGSEGAVRIFSGWMFASSPAISALEHPVYDVWLVECRASPASTGPR